jgi:hypothetical protein
LEPGLSLPSRNLRLGKGFALQIKLAAQKALCKRILMCFGQFFEQESRMEINRVIPRRHSRNGDVFDRALVTVY